VTLGVTPERCFIGLGSNLGDLVGTLDSAVERLKSIESLSELQCSSYYQSKPHGPEDQPDYVNAVASFMTTLEPEALLDRLQSIENSHGRVRSGAQWSARTLDLDILLYGNQLIKTARLSVPHPYMKQREFVLYPLYEIAPDLTLPCGQRLKDCLSEVSGESLVLMGS